jgi:hypothetical protein
VRAVRAGRGQARRVPEDDTPGQGEQAEPVSWYEHARAYAEAKWDRLAPVSRRSVAEALVTVTVALTAKERGAPEAKLRGRTRPPARQPGRPHPVDQRGGRAERRPPGRGQPRPGLRPPDSGTGPGGAGRAPGGVLRLPLLRRAAPVRGGHAPRRRPAPAPERVGKDRPGRLGVPRREGLDRRRHRPAGTRAEAPRGPRDPQHPHSAALVTLLRAHLKRYGTTPDGRVFRTAWGGVLQDSGYNEVWDKARKAALTMAQYRSPLGRRPRIRRRRVVGGVINEYQRAA